MIGNWLGGATGLVIALVVAVAMNLGTYSGEPGQDGIRITCDRCGESWLRDATPATCATCGGTELAERPQATTAYSRGTQVSIVGWRRPSRTRRGRGGRGTDGGIEAREGADGEGGGDAAGHGPGGYIGGLPD